MSEIEEWEREQAVTIAEDLKQLWNLKGGGELFESETILHPVIGAEDDLVLPRSKWLWGKGLDSEYYVFHEGLYVSVFRNSDKSLRSLNTRNFGQVGIFQTMDEWYLRTLRAEYGDRYGLPRI